MANVNWSILGGNGTINPNGATCHANPNNFLLIKVNEENACGSTEHYYYLSQFGYSPYRIYPNPAETEITIKFEYKEFADGLLKKIELIDLEGKAISKTINHLQLMLKNLNEETMSFIYISGNLLRKNKLF